jgi:hypothetical protein
MPASPDSNTTWPSPVFAFDQRRSRSSELVQAVGGLKSGAPLQTRVGIATGLVVVGDLIGSGAAQSLQGLANKRATTSTVMYLIALVAPGHAYHLWSAGYVLHISIRRHGACIFCGGGLNPNPPPFGIRSRAAICGAAGEDPRRGRFATPTSSRAPPRLVNSPGGAGHRLSDSRLIRM